MSVFIKQIRYYGDNDSRNYPKGLTVNDLAGAKASGTAFSNYLPCKFLKIKGPAGLKFFLNGATQENDSIILGEDGIYQIENNVVVTALRFDRGDTGTSHKDATKQYSGLINIFNGKYNISEPYLFIDFIYEVDD